MTIIRRKRNRNFTVINNAIMEDERLNYEAIGILTYLLSRPDDWTIMTGQLRARGGIGRDKMQAIMNLLITCGYVKRRKVMDKRTGRWSGVEYVVYDEPQTSTSGGLRGAWKDNPPEPDFPAAGFSGSEKRTDINKRNNSYSGKGRTVEKPEDWSPPPSLRAWTRSYLLTRGMRTDEAYETFMEEHLPRFIGSISSKLGSDPDADEAKWKVYVRELPLTLDR